MFRYDRLEERIRATGKKKVYLCEKIKKAPTYLRDAKKQNTNIKGVDLQILADELNTTPEYLTGESDKKEKSTVNDDGLDKETIQLQEIWNGADKEEREALLAMAKMLKARRNK